MTVLLTGATGFLGSRLLEQLLNCGKEVIAIKRSSSSFTRLYSVQQHPRLHLFDIDLHDPETLFAQWPVDTIIHTATDYGRSATPLSSILEANLLLPMRLAELGQKFGIRCFINTDTFYTKNLCSYSNLASYSLSKRTLRQWLDPLGSTLNVYHVRLEHVYGPFDSSTKFVEHVVQKVAVEQVPQLALTHGHQRRDFVFLDDVVQGFLILVDAKPKEASGVEDFEIGMGRSMQVRKFVSLVKEISRSHTELRFGDINYRDDEIMNSKADTARMINLGWRPLVEPSDGIQRILSAYGVFDATVLAQGDQ